MEISEIFSFQQTFLKSHLLVPDEDKKLFLSGPLLTNRTKIRVQGKQEPMEDDTVYEACVINRTMQAFLSKYDSYFKKLFPLCNSLL